VEHRTVARFERACLTHVLQQLAHCLEQQHRNLVFERLGRAVILDRDQQPLLLAHAVGQPAQRFHEAILVQPGRRQLEHQGACLHGRVGEHLFQFDNALNLLAIGEMALHRSERETHCR
jgi:hypothetical protein